MQPFAIFYLAISTALALLFAIGVVAAPKGQWIELATWGGVIAALWFFFLVALLVDVTITRVARLAMRFTGR